MKSESSQKLGPERESEWSALLHTTCATSLIYASLFFSQPISLSLCSNSVFRVLTADRLTLFMTRNI